MRTSWMFILVLTACSAKPGTDGGGADDSAGTDSEGPSSCEDLQSTPDIGPAVMVTVRHEGTTPVFFLPHGCGGSPTLSITDAADQNVPYLLNSSCSPNTCEGFINASDCSIGCNDCEPPNAGRVEAGAVTSIAWPGRRLTQLELIADCLPEATGCPATCVRPDQAPAGTYTLTLTVWRTCVGTCECDPPSSGVCGLWSGEQLDDPVTFTTTVDYPTQTAVELVITD